MKSCAPTAAPTRSSNRAFARSWEVRKTRSALALPTAPFCFKTSRARHDMMTAPPNRIDQKFADLRARGHAAFIAYICAGDPSLAATKQLALALEKVGVDILEL